MLGWGGGVGGQLPRYWYWSEISMHMSGSIITEYLSFCHVKRRSMEISIHMSGSII